MILHRALLLIDAAAAAVVLYFFLAGLIDGTITAFNIGLWSLIVIAVLLILFGGAALHRGGQRGLGNLLLLVMAVPAVGAGLVLLVLFQLPASSFH